jgi:hypothetical protein
VARAALLALATLLVLPACGPWGPKGLFAGGPYLGAGEPLPADASFADPEPLIGIETRSGWLRHSVTILCLVSEGRLYVMARHAPTKRWVRDVVADPRVRVEIGGRLYAGRAVRVDGSADEDARIARAFLRKYVGVDVDAARFLAGPPQAGDDHAEIWSFRIDPPDGPPEGAS